MEIISKESIKPSSPTPDHLRTFQFSLLDQLCPANYPYYTHILYYSHDNNTSIKVLNQPEISALLKRSLSDALALYYPFAGRMKDERSVDCNDEGVDVFEARVDAYLPDIIKSTRLDGLAKFVPTTIPESGGSLLRIQLNYFNCGGMAIGIALCHKIGDACTLSMFVKAWAAMACGGDIINMVAPSFLASSLFPYKDAVQHQLQMIIPSEIPESTACHTRRLCFSSSKIAALRAAAKTSTEPTRVELVTAAIWKWVMMARKGRRSQCGSWRATQVVNIRKRLEVPSSEFVFGNLTQAAEASGDGEMELGELVIKMREAVQGKLDREFVKELQGENGCDIVLKVFKKLEECSNVDREVDFVHFTSWCKFPFNDSDFGWGKPVWVSPGRHLFPITIMLMDSMSDIGGIEAWISTNEDYDYDDL